MKKLFMFYLCALACSLVFFSCSDDAPIGDSFAEDYYNAKGALVSFTNVTSGFFDLGDLDNANVAFDLSSEGEDVTNTELTVTRYDVDANIVGSASLTNVTSLPTTMTVTLNEVASALGINASDIEIGENFIIGANATSASGTFTSSRTLAAPASCLSELAGTYDFVSDANFCDMPTSGQITIVEVQAGQYTFDDWSLGSYNICYGGFAPANWGTLGLADVCNKLSLTGNTDNYGDTWTVTLDDISGPDMTLSYSNTYGESATAVITRPDGSDWPPLSF